MPALPDGVAELVDLLVQEIDFLVPVLDEALDGADTAAELGHFAEQVDRFADAAGTLGLDGLQRACAFLTASCNALAGRDAGTTPAEAALLRGMFDAVARYVAAPGSAPAIASIEACLADPQWPSPPGAEAMGDACAALAAPSLGIDDAGEPPPARPVQATPDLVTLSLPDDAQAELIDSLLEELPVITGQLAAAVGNMLEGSACAEDVNVAQRMAHTLKGAANTVGVAGLAHLTHHVEDILIAFTKHGRLPGAALADLLVRVCDCLEAMGEALVGSGPPPDDALEVLQLVLDEANRIDREGLPAEDAPPEAAEAPPRTEVEEPRPAAAARDVHQVRVPTGLVDELMRLIGETIIVNGQVQERVAGGVRQARGMVEQFGLLQQLGYELEQLIDLKDLSAPKLRAVNDAYFDSLEFDEYNELHTVSRRIVEAATDAREIGRTVERRLQEIESIVSEKGRLHRESHDLVLETRMVPVATVVSRLERCVRQAARTTGKRADLDVLGAETRMDAEILADVVPALMHLLRNAVDHGIEPAEVRAGAGKPAAGRIELAFSRVANQILIRCRDDGAGLDLAAIRETAVASGRLPAHAAPSDQDLHRLVLEPNFSTRGAASQTSGRGIGLDAVYGKLTELGGHVEIASEAGRGCTMELGVPLTLISAHALLVRVRRDVVAISTRGLEQIVHAADGELRAGGGSPTYRSGGDVYAATMLDALVALPPDDRASDREARTALVVQSDTGPVAVMVQEVIDSRDLVVKSFGPYVPKLRGIAGATILGDGSVAPVLDLPELLREPARRRRPDREGGTAEAHADLPTALVVDDSLSARRALARLMEDSGFRVRAARDGVEAVDILAGFTPDVVLVDLEMPRMNGLELAQHLRGTPGTSRVPIVMITSRSTAKHRRLAEEAGVDEYLTKPFADDDLLDRVTALRGCA